MLVIVWFGKDIVLKCSVCVWRVCGFDILWVDLSLFFSLSARLVDV